MEFDIAGSYDVNKYPWYSPHFVVRAMSKLTKLYGVNVENKREFQLAREMFDSAVALLGAYEMHSDNKYLLQPNLQSNSPDVVASKVTEDLNIHVVLEKTNLEIVTMNDYSKTDSIVEFLKRTKLSSKKSYDNKTLIICVVNKKIQINLQEIVRGLNEIKPKSSIYILGKLLDEKEEWTICSPYPYIINPVIYNISETMKKYQLADYVVLQRNNVRKITTESMGKGITNIFDIFNIDKVKVEKYKVFTKDSIA